MVLSLYYYYCYCVKQGLSSLLFSKRGPAWRLKHCKNKKKQFSIKNFFSKYDQNRRKLWIWGHIRKKSLTESLVFCAVKRYFRVMITLGKMFSFSYYICIESKTFIEASCTNNKHTGEKDFCCCYFWRFVSRFFSDSVKSIINYSIFSSA